MPDFPGKSRLQRAWQNGLRALDLDGIGKPEVSTGIEKYRAHMPPRLRNIEILGNLTDETGADYHGANGRSSVVGGRVYYALNKDPADVGVTAEAPLGFAHNTMAVATDPLNNPLAVTTCGKNSNGVDWRFMPLVNVEKYYVYDTPHSMLLYLTGGMCEYNEGDGRGYVWCERWLRGPRDDGRIVDVYKGTAIGLGTVDRHTGNISGERLGYGEILFKKGEPSYGTFCAVEDDMWYYTFGKQGEHVYLARVSKWTPITSRLYQTWDGQGFSEYRERIMPVFSGYSHGTVFRTSLFGESYKWAFIGLSSRGERTVDIGLAPNIWGPYKMTEIINPRQLPDGHEMTSSLFVHTWAFKEEMGQLMITWNDGNTGKIVGAKLQFAMFHLGICKQEISLSKMPSVFTGLAHARKNIIEAIAIHRRVIPEIDSDADGKAVIRLMGESPAALSESSAQVCEAIDNWRDEVTKDGLNDKLKAKKLL